MTAIPQPEPKSPSRRALLAGALGGIGAWAASAIGRTSPTQAANGDPVLLGQGNAATAVTTVTNSTAGTNAFAAQATGGGVALYGASSSGYGAYATSGSSYGIYAISNTGVGVRGYSSAGVGLHALNNAGTLPALIGQSQANSTGVLGVSGLSAPTAKPKTGVYGYANQDNTASAVYGLSPLGVGIRGHSASGYAGYFEGRVYTNAFYELGEVVNPAPPLANRARLFVRDNGAGKTQLCVRFRTGGVHIIKTEL
jgi:hypothetical protein